MKNKFSITIFCTVFAIKIISAGVVVVGVGGVFQLGGRQLQTNNNYYMKTIRNIPLLVYIINEQLITRTPTILNR